MVCKGPLYKAVTMQILVTALKRRLLDDDNTKTRNKNTGNFFFLRRRTHQPAHRPQKIQTKTVTPFRQELSCSQGQGRRTRCSEACKSRILPPKASDTRVSPGLPCDSWGLRIQGVTATSAGITTGTQCHWVSGNLTVTTGPLFTPMKTT